MKQVKSKIVMLPNKGKAGLGSICKKIEYQQYDLDSEVIDTLVVNVNPRINKSNKWWEAQHLYFTVEEEIKEGDWIIVNGVNGHSYPMIYGKRILTTDNSGQKKIYLRVISSTDPKLKLPKPSKDFLKQYCKKGGIDEVTVEYEEYCINNIPKEDHVCVNKDYRPKVFSDNTIIIHSIKDTWNEEEHIEDIKRIILCEREYRKKYSHFVDEEDLYKWIEENL